MTDSPRPDAMDILASQQQWNDRARQLTAVDEAYAEALREDASRLARAAYAVFPHIAAPTINLWRDDRASQWRVLLEQVRPVSTTAAEYRAVVLHMNGDLHDVVLRLPAGSLGYTPADVRAAMTAARAGDGDFKAQFDTALGSPRRFAYHSLEAIVDALIQVHVQARETIAEQEAAQAERARMLEQRRARMQQAGVG